MIIEAIIDKISRSNCENGEKNKKGFRQMAFPGQRKVTANTPKDGTLFNPRSPGSLRNADSPERLVAVTRREIPSRRAQLCHHPWICTR